MNAMNDAREEELRAAGDTPGLLARAITNALRAQPEREALAKELAVLLAGLPTPYTADEPTVRLHVSMLERIIKALTP